MNKRRSADFDRVPRSNVALSLLCLLWVVPPCVGAGITPTPSELGNAARWAAAKFDGPSSSAKPRAGLRVLANHDPVQLNARAGKPLQIVDARYTRGLYCHAISKVLVRLPGPGDEFTALVGVNSNDDTRGGRGSVHFLVGVGGQNRFKSPLMREGMAGLPLKVPLDGVSEFVLEVDDGGNGIGCDQADWAEARVKLKDGTEVWLADLGLEEAEISNEPPFTFLLEGKSSAEFLNTWKVERSRRELDANRTEHLATYSDPKTGLEARCRALEYRDFPTVEWTVYLKNLWRRWMVAWNIPRPGGTLPSPLLTPCSSHQFGEMIHANEQSQIQFIDRYQEEGFAIDFWWMDAGWYVNRSGWPNTGTWLVDSNRFPHGLRAITDHGHAKGVKSIVWFEPERVTGGTWLAEKHPEWLLKGTLLNLGCLPAREWLTDHIDQLLTEQGIDLYRQDYNIDPLEFWRSADGPDRQGITENHYVAGYLAYWDELLRRRPGMLIDSCASGGHRNDLETMRRSVPFLRSDYIFDPVANQCHSYGLALWLPYNGTGTGPRQFSLYE